MKSVYVLMTAIAAGLTFVSCNLLSTDKEKTIEMLTEENSEAIEPVLTWAGEKNDSFEGIGDVRRFIAQFLKKIPRIDSAIVVNSAEEFYGKDIKPEDVGIPEVDFNTHSVVFISYGLAYSGYGILLQRMTQGSDNNDLYLKMGNTNIAHQMFPITIVSMAVYPKIKSNPIVVHRWNTEEYLEGLVIE